MTKINMENNVKRFLCNCSWREPLMCLPDASRLKIYDAIFEFAEDGESKLEIDFDKLEQITFNFIKKELSYYIQSYQSSQEYPNLQTLAYARDEDKNKIKNKIKNKNININKKKIKEKESGKESVKETLFGEESVPSKPTLEEKKLFRQNGGLTPYRLKTLVQDDTLYGKFNKWLIENAPYIVDHYSVLISEKAYVNLRKRYSLDAICTVIVEIENRVDLRKKYCNLYMTTLKWLRNGNESYK